MKLTRRHLKGIRQLLAEFNEEFESDSECAVGIGAVEVVAQGGATLGWLDFDNNTEPYTFRPL